MSRLDYWKTQELNETDAKTIANIEKSNCQILHILEGADHPGWAYTIGLADTLGYPEIVVIGLPQKVSLAVVDGIADRARKGFTIEPGTRLGELMAGDYVCELREVRPQWYEHLFNWANSYYGSTDYPVLQCLWPDLDHHMPWEEGFNSAWLYDQPLLYLEDAAEARMDRFIAALAKSDGKCRCGHGKVDWARESDPHMAVFTQEHVAAGEAPVLLVAHYEDGWQMLDGGEVTGQPKVICLHHLVDRDPTLTEIADLPEGWEAWRDSVGGEWHRGLGARDDE